MAEVKRIAVVIDTVATISLNGDELSALDALAGYGVDEFIELFYKHMGEHYLKPHENGLRSFLNSVHSCKGMTSAADECREFLALSESDRRLGLHAGGIDRRRAKVGA